MSKKLNYEDLQSVKDALASATNAVNEAMIAEVGGVGCTPPLKHGKPYWDGKSYPCYYGEARVV